MTEARTGPTSADLALCAHDLRGILTVIAGYSALLRRDDLSAADRQAAHDGIDAAIARADALLDDTLAGRTAAQRTHERVAVDDVASRAVADAQVSTGREVTLSCSTVGVFIDADPVALARVLENVLTNATKYAPEGPIEVGVGAVGPLVRIEVSDRGPGVPDAEKESVFEPFVRLDRDSSKPGSGLGLVVVRSLVERMGGTVSILDRDGGGTTVRIEVPRDMRDA